VITRDFILRQIQQLAQVLAVVLVRKRTEDEAGAQATLAEGLEAATGVSLEKLRTMDRDALLALCEREGVFSAEWAVALADLLAEDEVPASWERAAWLYEAALAAGGPVPFDVDARIAALRAAGASGGPPSR
jgi:hypothetical protein